MSRRRVNREAPWRAEAEAEARALRPVQAVLKLAPEAWGKKAIIMACREAGAISGEAATLLLQAHQLETA